MKNIGLYDDKKVFALLGQGDATAFKVIFDRYFEKLRVRAFAILKSEFWAEEIVQETFLQCWNRRESLGSMDNPSGYLYTMVSNKCFDRIRRQQLEIEMQYVVSQVLHGNTVQAGHSAYDLTLLRRFIREAVQQLPEQRKLIYELQQEQGLTYQEIADKLDLSRNTVRNQMSRALHSIREYLLKKGFFLMILFASWRLL